MKIVVAGSGVGGMAVALGLGRAGHDVVVVDRDDVGTTDPEAAFARTRAGAPQSRQTHGLLARLTAVLRERFPDVLDELEARGAVVAPLGEVLGRTESDPTRSDGHGLGDDDLGIILVRRTTLEVVLRDAVRREPRIELRGGAAVVGLAAASTDPLGPRGVDTGAGGVPRITGVRLDDGEVVSADAVIAACGRRGGVVDWLAEVGVEVAEEEHGTNLVYLTRWYRRAGDGVAALEPKMTGDLGFVKFLGVPGDQGTFSATLAVPTADGELRRTLQDGAAFDAALSMLIDGEVLDRLALTPLSDVEPMAGFVNRLRTFTGPDGSPRVLGFHAIGDAHTCTNPLYGRGCSIALLHATLLVDAFAGTDDAEERARAFEAAAATEVTPWFHVSVDTDRAMRVSADPDESAGSGGGSAVPSPATELGKLLAAGERDPVIARGMLRVFNMLVRPDELAQDGEFLAHAVEALSDPDLTIPRPSGPTRAELLGSVAS